MKMTIHIIDILEINTIKCFTQKHVWIQQYTEIHLDTNIHPERDSIALNK